MSLNLLGVIKALMMGQFRAEVDFSPLDKYRDGNDQVHSRRAGAVFSPQTAAVFRKFFPEQWPIVSDNKSLYATAEETIELIIRIYVDLFNKSARSKDPSLPFLKYLTSALSNDLTEMHLVHNLGMTVDNQLIEQHGLYVNPWAWWALGHYFQENPLDWPDSDNP